MKILLLSGMEHESHKMLMAGLRAKGHTVTRTALPDLSIDSSILNNDLLILGDSHLFFTYAGHYAISYGIPVIPDPEMAQKLSMRTDLFSLARKNGIRSPNFYMGHTGTVMAQMNLMNLPLVRKELVCPHGSTLVRSPDELHMEGHRFLYLEEFIEGRNMLVYFIEEDIRVYEREPFSHEEDPVDSLDADEDVCELVCRWQNATKMNFGTLEVVRDYRKNELYLINAIPFPGFTHWSGGLERIIEFIEDSL